MFYPTPGWKGERKGTLTTIVALIYPRNLKWGYLNVVIFKPIIGGVIEGMKGELAGFSLQLLLKNLGEHPLPLKSYGALKRWYLCDKVCFVNPTFEEEDSRERTVVLNKSQSWILLKKLWLPKVTFFHTINKLLGKATVARDLLGRLKKQQVCWQMKVVWYSLLIPFWIRDYCAKERGKNSAGPHI